MINIKNLWLIEISGVEIWITETIFNTWIIMGILILLAIIMRIRMRSFATVPTGAQNIIEAVVEKFDDFAIQSVGENNRIVVPWFFAVFVFILSSSLFSPFGLRAPTADWATTFAMAIATFIIMVLRGLSTRGGYYIKSLFEPHFVFFPINLIGELAKPLSLSFRLFGNVLSGTIILTLYYALTPWLVQIGVPALFHAFFDVVIGFIQTYIFVIISLMYVSEASSE
ncbi:MAG TPA: F0F1 ATP synthase subunit A [Clostridiaceae bacterium]|nr:F0F1 ATP synthase subunit A [Clostridiaceae bacterium]